MPRWKEAGYKIICRIWFQSCNRNHIYTYSKTSSSIYIFGFQKISYSWKNTKYSDIVWGFNFILYVFPVFSTVRMTTFIARKKTIIFRVFFFFLKKQNDKSARLWQFIAQLPPLPLPYKTGLTRLGRATQIGSGSIVVWNETTFLLVL